LLWHYITLIEAEVMALKIRNSDEIHGIQIGIEPRREVKLTQLADDTTLFLKNDTDIIKELDLKDIFGRMSGLKLNRAKTEGL